LKHSDSHQLVSEAVGRKEDAPISTQVQVFADGHEVERAMLADLAKKYEGKQCQVYLLNGATLYGRITFRSDGWIEVTRKDTRGGNTALCNLSHTAAIALVD